MLVIDGIVTAQRTAPDEQVFNEFVHELQGIAIASDCTVFMLTSAQGDRVTPEHTMVDGIIELSDRASGWASESVLQVVKFRGGPVLRGLHAFKITGDGIVVHPRTEELLAWPSHRGSETTARVASGVPRLDELLRGGLPAASSTIIMGPAGVGKTTFGLQFLSRCSEAEPGLMFGFYETPARLSAKVREICAPLGELVEKGVVAIEWQPPNGDLLDAFAERLLEGVRRRNVRRVFLDGLGAVQQMTRAEPGRIGSFLTALMNELRALGVTAVHTLEIYGPMGPMIEPPIAGLSNLGENLIMLRHVEKGVRLHRLISILKVRDSDFDPSVREFIIRQGGLQISDVSDSAALILTDGTKQPGKVFADGPIEERHGR
jgi:circadian clock protein KaiC